MALIEIVGERTAERGYSNGGSSEPMPALSGIFATAGTTEESGSEDETVSASVQVGSGDGDDSTPAVRIESLKKGNGETGAVVAAGKGKAGVTVQTSAEPSRALSSHSTRMRLAGKIGGFSLLLVLAYLFLDAGRRQRYIWPRRVAIVAAFLGVCAFLSRIVPLM
ncbi:MAG TPA: hypothetical protein VMV94_03170 [Phycisphaerae bacterium]|nr:hypothetical protein [Phycisphaerae bacterium]